jgi:hypothetical protein
LELTDFRDTAPRLPAMRRVTKPFGMFLVTDADADAIRAIFNQEGKLSAAIELRRRFPGFTDNAKARIYVRTIAGWKPPPSQPCSVIRLRPRGTSQSSLTASNIPTTEPAG